MLFCPTCANLLVISAETGYNKWACNTCAYEFPIAKQMTSRTRLKRKAVDDVLGGDDAWKNADSTNAYPCPKCDNSRAYYYQLQIRSADEPMTTSVLHAFINGVKVECKSATVRKFPRAIIFTRTYAYNHQCEVIAQGKWPCIALRPPCRYRSKLGKLIYSSQTATGSIE